MDRVKELFKYFLSISQAIGYVDIDIESKEAYNPEAARLSSDPILNALAQLAAHRLSCDRAFISLIDKEYQYIVAEATREISIYETKLHPPGQGLCVGARPLDLIAGVCAGTMPAFTDGPLVGPYKSTANVYADRSRYIINNFAVEDDYKERPYVVDFPFMRYYAEVPINGPAGSVIGTLAVVDNKPRVGLDDWGYIALTEVSKAVMKHLQNVKIQQDHLQSSRLLKGFNTFVQSDGMPTHTGSQGVDDNRASATISHGATSAHEALQKQNRKRPRLSSTLSTSTLESDEGSRITPSSDLDSYRLTPSTAQPSLDGPSAPESISIPSGPDLSSEQISASLDQDETNNNEENDKIGTFLRDTAVSDDVRKNFSRAAAVLRQAMDLDGVIFLDAALTDFASRSDLAASNNPFGSYARRGLDNATSDSSEDNMDELELESPTGPPTLQASEEHLSRAEGQEAPNFRGTGQSEQRMSGRLGYSTRQTMTSTENVISPFHFSLPEIVHQSLLRRYPKGHVFDFNQERAPLPDERTWQRSVASYVGLRTGSRRGVMKRADINIAIRFACPNVCSAIFNPLWHPQKESWFASSLGWTTRHKRILQKEDLSYHSVFGNSVMAEVTRLELIASDRAKSDFISSISHELRSPLHGVLGSVELLRETDVDSDQLQMITMVENCGRTMLDTMDHILDFAKINKTASEGKEYNKRPSISTRSRKMSVTSEKQSSFDLDKVVEETVESLVTGHRYNIECVKLFSNQNQPQSYATLVENEQSGISGKGSKPSVVVVLDMDKQSTWRVESDAAAWRRIILNLLGNALKYTSSGLIEIILQARDVDEEENANFAQKLISFTVRDTGCGIGKAYLQNHLYTPFVQENGLSNGTGLGLSIVQKVVHDLQGNINVQSEVGVGTRVDVLVPLRVLKPQEESTTVPLNLPTGRLCLLGFELYPDLSGTPTGILSHASKTVIALKSALENYAKQWLGLNVISASSADQVEADIIVISEESLDLLKAPQQDGSNALVIPSGTSVIIVATSYDGSEYYKTLKSDRIQILEQPFGPRRIKHVIDIAMRADRTDAVQHYQRPGLVTMTSDQTITQQDNNRTALPEAKYLSHPQATPGAEQTSPRSALQQPSKRNLLLVDDNSINLTMLAAHASKLQCNYTTAINGEEALNAYRNAAQPFDYILMDVSMPVMDGFASTRAIRDFEKANGLASTPVIALTGLGSAAAHQEAFTSGMNMFLTKPVSMKKIKTLVEQGLAGLEQA